MYSFRIAECEGYRRRELFKKKDNDGGPPAKRAAPPPPALCSGKVLGGGSPALGGALGGVVLELEEETEKKVFKTREARSGRVCIEKTTGYSNKGTGFQDKEEK